MVVDFCQALFSLILARALLVGNGRLEVVFIRVGNNCLDIIFSYDGVNGRTNTPVPPYQQLFYFTLPIVVLKVVQHTAIEALRICD